nr:MAG TPA: hypothetical protein [Bacteriophage sp.]
MKFNYNIAKFIKRLKFKRNYAKLKRIFKKNENSGLLIPTNLHTRNIGKTYLLIKTLLEENADTAILVKYQIQKKNLKEQIRQKVDWKDFSSRHIEDILDTLVLDFSDLEHHITGKGIKYVYIDEGFNSEDIMLIEHKYNLKIKNGFYYSTCVRSPLEFNKKEIKK